MTAMELELPASLHTEVAVLGAMLLDESAVHQAMATLAEYDFSLDSHQRIFRAMAAMYARNLNVDTITVRTELDSRKELERIGGYPYLAYLTDGIPHKLNIEEYAKTLSEASMKRKGIQVCSDALQRLGDPSERAEDVFNDIGKHLIESRSQKSVSAADLSIKAWQYLNEGGGTVIPTGITMLDEVMKGGLRTKELCVIGAHPSRGKSSLLRQFERGAINHGFPVDCYTLEMSKEDWLLLHAFRYANVPAWKLRQPSLLQPVDSQRILDAMGHVSEWPMNLDDEAGISIDSLIARSKLSILKQNHANGKDIGGMVTIDYLQLMSGGQGDNLAQRMGYICKRLKQFAKETNRAVVLLSQLSRADNRDVNKKPNMQMLKESGDIEAHADVILMPYRPVDPDSGKFLGEGEELIFTKQRWGKIGGVPAHYNEQHLEYEVLS